MNDMNQQMQAIMEQGRQQAQGMITAGKIVIDASPKDGFFRVRLLGIQPLERTEQLTNGLCWVISQAGRMFGIEVKARTREVQDE